MDEHNVVCYTKFISNYILLLVQRVIAFHLLLMVDQL